jgi:hypothetical protein
MGLAQQVFYWDQSHGQAASPSFEGPQEDVMRRDGEARGMKKK